MEIQGTQNSQNNVKREEWSWKTLITYYKITVIKTVWSWHKGRHVDEWNRVSPEINGYIYSQLIIKSAKTIQWGKNSICNNCCWDKWIFTCRRMNLVTSQHRRFSAWGILFPFPFLSCTSLSPFYLLGKGRGESIGRRESPCPGVMGGVSYRGLSPFLWLGGG